MKPTDNVRKFFKNAAIETNPRMDEAVLNKVLISQEKTTNAKSPAIKLNVGKTIMKSPVAGLAASALILIAAVLVLAVFSNRATTPAYALNQTREANHRIRSIHVKRFDAEHNDNPIEFWIECDEFGKLKNACLHLPEWLSPEGGAQVVVWKEGKMQIWLKGKNVLFIVGGPWNTCISDSSGTRSASGLTSPPTKLSQL